MLKEVYFLIPGGGCDRVMASRSEDSIHTVSALTSHVALKLHSGLEPGFICVLLPVSGFLFSTWAHNSKTVSVVIVSELQHRTTCSFNFCLIYSTHGYWFWDFFQCLWLLKKRKAWPFDKQHTASLWVLLILSYRNIIIHIYYIYISNILCMCLREIYYYYSHTFFRYLNLLWLSAVTIHYLMLI